MFDIKKFPLVSDQVEYDEIAVIIRETEKVLLRDVPGDIVELGCYTGTTALFTTRLLKAHGSSKVLHVYDSFSGLPPKVSADSSPSGTQFVAGELKATKQQLIKHFKQAGLQLPVIHKVWFESLTATDMPSAIAVAFLDGDFYTSIKSSLDAVGPLMSKGGVILIDDYSNEALPGARKAADEWASRHNLTVRAEKSLGIIRM